METEYLKKIIDNHNMNTLSDFIGFSPNEMYSILYRPFEESCPIKIKKIIPATTLEKIPTYRICKDILTYIKAEDGIKLTKTGNFPLKTVINIYDKKYLEDTFIESGITKLRSEKDWLAFHSIHISMGLGGLVRKYRGKVLLTKKSQSYLLNNNESGLFKEILISYCIKFNWAYNDYYDNPFTGQFGFLFLLYLLLIYDSDPFDLKCITNKYFKWPDYVFVWRIKALCIYFKISINQMEDSKMKKRYLFPFLWCPTIVLLTILFNPMSIFSADISGSWKAEFDTQIGVQKYTFVFVQTDSGITGTASSDIGGEKQEVQLTEVKLDSNKISFNETLLFQGMDLLISYEGTVSENEMKLTRNVGDFITEELVAKREEKTE